MTHYDWLQSRLGRFTASEIHKLFVGGKRPMTEDELKEEKAKKGRKTTVETLFGEGAETYIRSKAAELLTCEVKEEIDFKQTEWGKQHEADACAWFEQNTYKSGTHYGGNDPVFFPFGEYAGVSPDWEGGTEEGADFKCPYNSAVHVENLSIKSVEEFKVKRWEYYCQAQMGMVVRGWKFFYFVSYDPRIVEPSLRMKIITLLPDVEWVQEFLMRLEMAIERLQEILNSIENSFVSDYLTTSATAEL
jgi:hypothetical protein